jgi:uncharacterized protein (TIGR02145 family)
MGNSRTEDGSGIGSFNTVLRGLNPSTTYYARSYAKNSNGVVVYGSEVSFTTFAVLPTVTTTSATSITSIGATTGGNVTADGGASVTARGVAYDTAQNPTTANSTTSDVPGIGSFISTLSGLTSSTLYYVRAYATNSVGTAYGNEVSFTTFAVFPYAVPTVTTTSATSITSTGATTGGDVFSDGGASVRARGVAYGTAQNPTTADSTTSNGTGTGSFTSTLSGLTSSTLYYVRAYATNAVGTAYGNEVSFTTFTCGTSTVSDVDNNTYNTVQIGTQCWMQSNLKVSKYRNGDTILTGLSNSAWQGTFSGAYAILNNDPVNDGLFGKLYNYFAVLDSRGLCPTGWHVPSDAEWNVLTKYLDPSADTTPYLINIYASTTAGGALKSTATLPTPGGWASPNTGATNSSGFSALPGYDAALVGFWWSSSFSWSNIPLIRYLENNSSIIYRIDQDHFNPFSVRCKMD